MTGNTNYQPQPISHVCINCSASLLDEEIWLVTKQHQIVTFCKSCANAYNMGTPIYPAIPLTDYAVPDRREYKPIWVPPGVNYGNFNNMPEPHERIDRYEFFRLMWTTPWAAHEREFRQVKLPELPGHYIHTYIYWWKGFAIAVANWTRRPYHKEKTEPDLTFPDSAGHYNYEFFFYYIGCRHHHEELSPESCRELGIFHGGMHHHVYQCSKCKAIYDTDSSD